MSADEEHVLWSHYTNIPPTGRSRSLMVGVALLIVALVRQVGLVGPSDLDGFFGLALIAGTGLVLLHLLKERRLEILRVWTDPGRPGVVLVRSVDGAVRKLTRHGSGSSAWCVPPARTSMSAPANWASGTATRSSG